MVCRLLYPSLIAALIFAGCAPNPPNLGQVVSSRSEEVGDLLEIPRDDYLYRAFRLFYKGGTKNAPVTEVAPTTAIAQEQLKELLAYLTMVPNSNSSAGNLVAEWRDAPKIRLANGSGAGVVLHSIKEIVIDLAIIRGVVNYIVSTYFGGLNKYAEIISGLENHDMALVSKILHEEEAAISSELHGEVSNSFAGAPSELTVLKRLNEASVALVSTLHFMILHEYGHVNLGHLDKIRSLPIGKSCEAIKLFEFDADDYAAQEVMRVYGGLLDSSVKMGNAARVFDEDAARLNRAGNEFRRLFSILAGFDLAFSDLPGLHGGRSAIAGCVYPTRQERRALILKKLPQSRKN